jgi:hypothetical protein
MKKVFTWMLSGAIAVALMVVLKEVFRLWTPPLFPSAGLLHLSLPEGRAISLLWELLWGALYAAAFYLAVRHILPSAAVSAALLYALILFLVTVLLLPMLKKLDLSAAITPAMLMRASGACAFYSLVMVLVGKQMEK